MRVPHTRLAFLILALATVSIVAAPSALWAQSAPVNAVVWDTFTNTDGQYLNDHQPDIRPPGAAWAALSGSAQVINLKLGGGTLGLYDCYGYCLWGVNSGQSDVTVAVDLKSSSSSSAWGGITFRAIDSENRYQLNFPGPVLYRKQAGDWTVLGNSTQTMAAGQTYRLEVRAVGSLIQVYWNHVLLYAVNDSTFQTATTHGLVWHSSDTSMRFDNFQVSAPNRSPVLTSPANQTNTQNSGVSATIAGNDPDGDALGYGAYGLPPGLTVNSSTGVISGTLPSITGTYYVTATASDGTVTSIRPFTWTVTAPGQQDAPPAVYVRDTFTYNDGQYLTTHQPDVAPAGAAWQNLMGHGTYALVGGGTVGLLDGGGYELWGIQSGHSDVTVSVDMKSLSPTTATASPWGGVVVRATDGNNLYQVNYPGPVLYRKQGGDFTVLARGQESMVAGQTYHLEVRVTGTLIRVFWNNVLEYAVNDSTFPNATMHGLAWHSSDVTTRMDNFEVTAPNAPPVITGPSDQASRLGATPSAIITASDPEGATLLYGAAGLPNGLSVNPYTGVISGTAATSGTYAVSATAWDGITTATRPFTWTVTSGDAPANTVTVFPATVNPGSAISVSVANGPGNPLDWVALSAVGSSATSYVVWKYIGGGTSATVPLTVPLTTPAGAYEIRFLQNDGYVRLATSSAVTVQPLSPGPAITASPAAVNPGGQITVSVANGPGNIADWVALFPTSVADPNNGYFAWQYLNGLRTSYPSVGITSATLQFVAPMTPGTYNVRFFANDGWTRLATSDSISVQTVAPTVTSPSTTVNAGSTFMVNVAHGPGNIADWVALFPTSVADPNNGYFAWQYLNGLRTSYPSVGITSATLQFVAPMTPGTYNVRFFANDGWTKLATSNTITVPGTPPPFNHAPVISGPGGQTNYEADSVSLGVAASDPDGDVLTYGAAGLPAGLSINSSSGLIAGTLTPGLFGTYAVTFSVTDGAATATASIQWNVLASPDTLVIDTFSGANGTSLGSHAPDVNRTGSGWQRLYGYGDATLQDGKAAGSGPTYEIWTFDTSRSDVDISVDFSSTDPTPYGGIVFRATNLDNYYLLRYDGPSLLKRVNGYWFTVGSGQQSAAGGTTFHLELRARGSQFEVYSNGVLQYTAHDAWQQTATRHGLLWRTPEDATALMDNFRIVQPDNRPVIDGLSTYLQREGAATSAQISASDPEGSTLTYGASGLPSWLSLNTSTGLITGTAPFGSMGAYPFTASASDGLLTTTRDVLWTVARADVRVYDTFNDADATLLGFHSPNLSQGGWQHLEGSGAAPLDHGTVGSSGPGYEVWTLDSGLSDVTLSVDVTSTDATPYGGLVFRATDANNYFMLRYDGPYLYRKQSGQLTTVGWWGSTDFNPGETHRLEVRTHGPTIDVFSDGVFQYSVTDSFQQNATTHGLMWYPNEDATVAMDNFVVSVPDGAPIISGLTNQTSRAGMGAAATIAATSPGGGTLTYGASGLPPGLSVNSSTGAITGVLPLTSAGNYTVTASASNGVVQTTRAFVWAVMSPSTLLYDSFTGNRGTSLIAHSPDLSVPGAWWGLQTGSGNATLGGGKVTSTGTSYEIWTADVGQSDVDVSVDVSSTDATPYGGLVFRAADASTYLMLRYDGPTLYRRQNGNFTTVAWGSRSIAGGQSHHLEVHAHGSQIEVLSDGVVQFTVTDSFNQTATRHGLMWHPLEDATLAFDNFRIDAPAGTPVIFSPTDMTGTEGATVSGSISALDPAGAPLTYSAGGLPPGVVLDSLTGVFVGTHAAGSAFTYPVTLTVSNGAASASRRILWTVFESETTTRIFDSFKQTNGQSLASHNFDVGPAGLRWYWLRGLYIPEIANETVHTYASSPQTEAWTTDVGLADVTVSVDVHSNDATPYGGLVFRGSDVNNFLFLRYQGPYLYKFVDGDFHTLAGANDAFNAGETHRLKVRAVGNRIDVYSDGVLKFTVNEAFNQTASRHGLLWNPIEDPTLTFDNFELRSDRTITVIPVPPPCWVTVSPLTMTVNNENNTWTNITVTNQPGCDNWGYDSEAAHIPEIGRYSSGVNTWTVFFSIENNTDRHPRTLHFPVAGHTLTVIQDAGPNPCTYATAPSAPRVDSAAHTATLNVSANCAWTAASQSSFIHVTGTAVQVNGGTVSYLVDANPDSTRRTGTLQVGDASVLVTQLGVGQTVTDEPVDTDISYYHADAIGSVRMITDASGVVRGRYDYTPTGVEFDASSFHDPRMFAGKEHDTETGFGTAWGALDYFGARYYQSQTGRFTTVDPVLDLNKALVDPQRWNRYTYARNNPLGFLDPDGRDPIPTQWQMTYGADGLARVLPAVAKGLFNFFVTLNVPGDNLTPEGEARYQAQFFRPASTEEAVIMTASEWAMVAAPLLRGAGRASAIETSATGRGGLSVAEEIGILRDAAAGRGNVGLGSATGADAARLGEAWVGKGYTVASDGKTLVSANGLRQYRPPLYKPNLGRTQANFEQRPAPWGAWGANGHLDIVDNIP